MLGHSEARFSSCFAVAAGSPKEVAAALRLDPARVRPLPIPAVSCHGCPERPLNHIDGTSLSVKWLTSDGKRFASSNEVPVSLE